MNINTYKFGVYKGYNVDAGLFGLPITHGNADIDLY